MSKTPDSISETFISMLKKPISIPSTMTSAPTNIVSIPESFLSISKAHDLGSLLLPGKKPHSIAPVLGNLLLTLENHAFIEKTLDFASLIWQNVLTSMTSRSILETRVCTLKTSLCVSEPNCTISKLYIFMPASAPKVPMARTVPIALVSKVSTSALEASVSVPKAFFSVPDTSVMASKTHFFVTEEHVSAPQTTNKAPKATITQRKTYGGKLTKK